MAHESPAEKNPAHSLDDMQNTPLHLLFQAKKNVRHFFLLLCFLHHILQGKGESTRCKIFLALTDLSLTNHAM